MQIGALTQAANPPSGTTSANSTAKMNYDNFLRLLVAEIENQDPTSPLQSSDFVAQLATFSTVEQSMQTNAKLDQILTLSAVSRADGLIGRTVTSADGNTSGEVKSVLLTEGGAKAILASGQEIQLGAGVSIS